MTTDRARHKRHANIGPGGLRCPCCVPKSERKRTRRTVKRTERRDAMREATREAADVE